MAKPPFGSGPTHCIGRIPGGLSAAISLTSWLPTVEALRRVRLRSLVRTRVPPGPPSRKTFRLIQPDLDQDELARLARLQGDLGFVPELGRVARGQLAAVQANRPADEVQVAAHPVV